jgi:starch phosphorylase
MYYKQPGEYAKVMRWAISLNGSYYNTERMVFQYLTNAYLGPKEHKR